MPSSGPMPRETFASLLDAQARSASAGSEVVSGKRPGATTQTIEAILGSAPGPQAQPSVDAADAFARIYADEPVTAEKSMPSACNPEAVARELQLTPQLTARELERIRRNFALANHPDRVASGDHDLATRRMTLANMLIDQALQGKRNHPSR